MVIKLNFDRLNQKGKGKEEWFDKKFNLYVILVFYLIVRDLKILCFCV